MSAGKGDRPRHIFSEKYRNNYDDIFRKKKTLTPNPEYATASHELNIQTGQLEPRLKPPTKN